jgi:hypothetical protein
MDFDDSEWWDKIRMVLSEELRKAKKSPKDAAYSEPIDNRKV